MIGKKKFKCLGCSWFKKRLSGKRKCNINQHPDICSVTPDPPDFPEIIGEKYDDWILKTGDDLDE